jgi:Spy/CpxP family protein refolding chaperone
MKSLRFRLFAAALAVLMGSAIAKSQTTADAPPPPPMRGHGFGMGVPMMGLFARQLNLTDDQKAQMKDVMQKERPAVEPLRKQQRQLDLQLLQYVEGNFDQAKVQALANQKAQIEAQLTVQETRIGNELYQLLTADQQTQLKQIVATHEARMRQRANQPPPGPPAEQ